MLSANQITAELLLRIQKEFGEDQWVWRNNRITAKAIGRGGATRHVSAGIDGQGDITGMAAVDVMTMKGIRKRVSIRMEIEVKSHNDRIRPTQEAFAARCSRMGAFYLVVSDVDRGIRDIREWLCQFDEARSNA